MRNNIRDFLSSQGITRYRFWKDTGVALRTAYDLYDNPNRVPASKVLDKICRKYGIQPSDIIKISED